MLSASLIFSTNGHQLWLLLGAILVIPLLTIFYDLRRWYRMPPGPTPIPFVGNTQLPKRSPWIRFQEWSRTYGPIFTIWIGRRPTIIISDPIVAAELLEKRSSKYSSRPRMVAMGEIYWQNSSVLVQPYGKEWSVRRKLLHHALTPSALRLYKPVQEAEASRLCYQLLHNPMSWEKLIERFTSSVVFCVSYGHRIDSLSAEVIRKRFEFMHYSASLNVPGKYLVESFPLLKLVPNVFAPWKREIQEKGQLEAAENLKLVDVVKKDLAQAQSRGDEDTVPDSLCKLLLDLRSKEHIPLSDRDFSFIPASLFGAGSDTTASTLCSAFLAIVTHPQTLSTAQAELDAVVGPDRTPTFADEASLPYLRALVKEVLRWRPVAVLGGTPHASTEDDVYEGYHIPAGTTVLGNSWAINLNEDYYPKPHLFEPLRFLSSPKALAELGLQPEKTHPARAGHSSFGWGRRICPGADLAANSLFVALAKTMWGFDIRPIEGVEYDIFAYTEGFNIRPRKFECVIEVRSEAHQKVMVREQRVAEGVLERFTAFQE
ncbi:hypothetical protein B0A49_02553 [Cryomyces minteri]|uniref:Cytochrome P450 n=1 Tax=Cryomyces minteri TaxID=331657 RepID=A0A4U0XHI6_9PEZI|nr:hypothetical protein B0A49_02553 [Cryomyces minteri]